MKTIIFSILIFIGIALHAQTTFNVSIKGENNEQAILFFPGFACTGDVWSETVKELSKDYKCYVFTFAGFGEVPPIKESWLKNIKEEIIEFVKDEKLDKPILIGHSLGGTLSYWLAISEPDMFKEIIAVDALPGSAALMIPNYHGQKIPYDNPRSQKLLQMDDNAFNKMIEKQVKYMCHDKTKQKFIAKMMETADRKTFVYGYIDMLNLDLRDKMGEIKIPVTVLAATFPNKAIVKKTYKNQFEKLPSVKIHFVEHSAHFVMFDRPKWFMKKLKEILK